MLTITRLRLLFTVLLSLFFAHSFAQQDSATVLNTVAPHPRLFLQAGGEAEIQKSIQVNPLSQKIHNAIMKEADQMTTLPSLQYKLTGRRLLGVSREALRRIFYLSYAWRMTHKEPYKVAAIANLDVVTHFPNWNHTQHFLDVGEMTLAVSIGYDWLYDQLSTDEKYAYKNAIIQFGLIPSLNKKYNGWLSRTNNWNQVCNGGVSVGAMAVYEDSSAFCNSIINRSIQSVQISMKAAYSPQGAYPEGYAYWGYGTTYNVLMIAALENVFHSDFGLSSKPGFMATAHYLENETGSSGKAFNYSDGGEGYEPQPAMAWFAQKEKNPSLLWIENEQMALPQNEKSLRKERMLPFYMVWNKNAQGQIKMPEAKCFFAPDGNAPLSLMRTDWDMEKGIFLAFKGGTPSENHAHMDVGSFVMDADGERWAMDLGAQDYYSLESKGVDLWNNRQYSQRWEVYRYNNRAHNTLTVDDSLQRVKGFGKIIKNIDRNEFKGSIADISSLYEGFLKQATRGVAIVDNQYVAVRDELVAGDKDAHVSWALVTKANCKIVDNHTVELMINEKKLLVKIVGNISVNAEVEPATPTNSFDAANPGVSIVRFTFSVKKNTAENLSVLLLPEKSIKKNIKANVASLSEWN